MAATSTPHTVHQRVVRALAGGGSARCCEVRRHLPQGPVLKGSWMEGVHAAWGHRPVQAGLAPASGAVGAGRDSKREEEIGLAAVERSRCWERGAKRSRGSSRQPAKGNNVGRNTKWNSSGEPSATHHCACAVAPAGEYGVRAGHSAHWLVVSNRKKPGEQAAAAAAWAHSPPATAAKRPHRHKQLAGRAARRHLGGLGGCPALPAE